MTDLPGSFKQRMHALLGAEAEALFEALERPPTSALRVNTLKLSSETFEALSPWALRAIPWSPDGFLLSDDAQAGAHPYHAAGLYYLQEPSAQAVAQVLDPQPGERVLDLAAAPGGKSTHLSALIQDEGLLVANEVNRGRAKALLQNLERWGCRNVLVTSEEVGKLAKRWGAQFDAVLLDAPCSGEGMFRKSEVAREMWGEGTVLGCARRQEDLLAEAAELVGPGGRLVYSTCTFAPEENEGVVADFLRAQPEFQLEPFTLPGAAPGRPDWTRDAEGLGLEHSRRLWPHKIQGEGHFIARLRKNEGLTSHHPSAEFYPVPERTRQAWKTFCRETLTHDLAEDRDLTMFGPVLYALPADVPLLKGLRALRCGLPLAKVKKDRLEPAHALALSLTAGDTKNSIALEDDRLERYLQGLELACDGPDGWLLMRVAGYGLGWGRRVRGIVKNAYPKGLRTG